MPEYGFRTAGFAKDGTAAALRSIAEIGFDAVEICLETEDVRPGSLDRKSCDALNKLLDELGLHVASVSYHGDADPPDEKARNIGRSVEIATWFNTDVLIINSERATEKSRQWQRLVDNLKSWCDDAEQLGVNLAMEPEPLLVVHDTNDMMKLIDDVDSDRLCVNLDIGHAYITDDDLWESIHRLGKRIVHTHFEDIKGKVHKHLIPGTGDIDLRAVHNALQDIDYRGYYVIDMFGIGDDPERIARRCLDGLREAVEGC